MYTAEALLDLHGRSHRNLEALLVHCRQLTAEELDRQLAGFGYPTVQLQFHHVIGAEEYWIGVLQGRVEADDDAPKYQTIASLEAYRESVFAKTEDHLRGASSDELNTVRTMLTWGNKEHLLMPAHVFLRTMMHIYHHQGQICAMCRLMEKPTGGLDFPITQT